jgi:hypothetical protein
MVAIHNSAFNNTQNFVQDAKIQSPSPMLAGSLKFTQNKINEILDTVPKAEMKQVSGGSQAEWTALLGEIDSLLETGRPGNATPVIAEASAMLARVFGQSFVDSLMVNPKPVALARGMSPGMPRSAVPFKDAQFPSNAVVELWRRDSSGQGENLLPQLHMFEGNHLEYRSAESLAKEIAAAAGANPDLISAETPQSPGPSLPGLGNMPGGGRYGLIKKANLQ